MFTTVVAVVAAVLGAVSLVLHAVSPLTANTYDDKLEAFVDEALSMLHSASVTPGPIATATK